MFALKCRRNYAISAQSISISQRNIVLIVTAVINLICSGESTLPPRTFPSCRSQFGAVCFLREELFLQQAGLQAQATGQGVQFSALLLPAYVTLNTTLRPQLTRLWNGDGLRCPMETWSVVPSSLTPPSPKAASRSAAAWNAGNLCPAHCSCPLSSSRRARLLRCEWRQTHRGSFPKPSGLPALNILLYTTLRFKVLLQAVSSSHQENRVMGTALYFTGCHVHGC